MGQNKWAGALGAAVGRDTHHVLQWQPRHREILAQKGQQSSRIEFNDVNRLRVGFGSYRLC